jgi:hypothetical protein
MTNWEEGKKRLWFVQGLRKDMRNFGQDKLTFSSVHFIHSYYKWDTTWNTSMKYDNCFLRRKVMYYGRQVPFFRQNWLPPSSGQKSKVQMEKNDTDVGDVRFRTSATRKPKWSKRKNIKYTGHLNFRLWLDRQKEICRNRVSKQWPLKGLSFRRIVNGRKNWGPTGAGTEAE